MSDVQQDGSPGLMGSTRRTVQVAAATVEAVTAQEDGTIFDCLGLATLNLPPLANVANGFSILVIGRAAAAVGVTIDPNGTEQINSLGAGVALVLGTANFERAIVYKAADQWIGTGLA